MRYPLLDGFRGFFLLFMTIVHANIVLMTVAGTINHHSFGWVEDAQGFVFISGFVVALVYGRALDKGGFDRCVRTTYRRVRTIYVYQALLIFLLLGMSILIPAARVTGAFQPYVEEPFWFTVASLALVGTSEHMGILPMYIFFMLLLPFVLVSLSRGNWPAVLAASLLVWLIGQTRLPYYSIEWVEAHLAARGVPLPLGVFFNIFCWQILFFGGTILGYQLNRDRLPLHLFHTEAVRELAKVCFAAIILLGLFDRAIGWNLMPDRWQGWYMDVNRRQHFGPLQLIAFAVALQFVSWSLIAGRTDRNPLFRGIGNVIHAIVSHPAMIFLGQHSLQVFAWHVLLYYVLALLFFRGPPDELTGTLVLLASAASLYIPAWIHARWQKFTKAAVPWVVRAKPPQPSEPAAAPRGSQRGDLSR